MTKCRRRFRSVFECTRSLKFETAMVVTTENSSENTDAEMMTDNYEIRRQRNRRSATNSRHRQREKIKHLEQEVAKLEDEGFELSRTRSDLMRECVDLQRTLATLKHATACRFRHAEQNVDTNPDQQVPNHGTRFLQVTVRRPLKDKCRNASQIPYSQTSSSVTNQFGTSLRVISAARPSEKSQSDVTTIVRSDLPNVPDKARSDVLTNVRPVEKTRSDYLSVEITRSDVPPAISHSTPSLPSQTLGASSTTEPFNYMYSALSPSYPSTGRDGVVTTSLPMSTPIKTHSMLSCLTGCVMQPLLDSSRVSKCRTLNPDHLSLSVPATGDIDKAYDYDSVLSNPLRLSCTKPPSTTSALKYSKPINNLADYQTNSSWNSIANPSNPVDATFSSNNMDMISNQPQAFVPKETSRFSSTVSVHSFEDFTLAKSEDTDSDVAMSMNNSRAAVHGHQNATKTLPLSTSGIDTVGKSGIISLTSSTHSKQSQLPATTRRIMASEDLMRPCSTSTCTVPSTEYISDNANRFNGNNVTNVPNTVQRTPPVDFEFGSVRNSTCTLKSMDRNQRKQIKGTQSATLGALSLRERTVADWTPMVQHGFHGPHAAVDGVLDQTALNDSTRKGRGVQANMASPKLPQTNLDFGLSRSSLKTPVLSSVEEALAFLMDGIEPFTQH